MFLLGINAVPAALLKVERISEWYSNKPVMTTTTKIMGIWGCPHSFDSLNHLNNTPPAFNFYQKATLPHFKPALWNILFHKSPHLPNILTASVGMNEYFCYLLECDCCWNMAKMQDLIWIFNKSFCKLCWFSQTREGSIRKSFGSRFLPR